MGSTKTLAFVVYPSVRLLDLVGNYSLLMGLEMGKTFRNVVVAERIEPLSSDTPLCFVPDSTFAQIPNPDALVVLGGDERALGALRNQALLDYVGAAAARAEWVAALDSGTLVLAAAGLLAGKRATTHWSLAGLLSDYGAQYVREPWVEDGRYITAAGVSGALDVGLYLTAKLKGENLARFNQLFAEYDPEPPFGGIDWTCQEHEFTICGGVTK